MDNLKRALLEAGTKLWDHFITVWYPSSCELSFSLKIDFAEPWWLKSSSKRNPLVDVTGYMKVWRWEQFTMFYQMTSMHMQPVQVCPGGGGWLLQTWLTQQAVQPTYYTWRLGEVYEDDDCRESVISASVCVTKKRSAKYTFQFNHFLYQNNHQVFNCYLLHTHLCNHNNVLYHDQHRPDRQHQHEAVVRSWQAACQECLKFWGQSREDSPKFSALSPQYLNSLVPIPARLANIESENIAFLSLICWK